ncbi:ATP-dependent protease ATPase subunit HslU [Algisphaera agarilytica]|uniref:ATP-dependent HslUV protease ATP-binding subunit HslU n=1 Tax=Algisphaera agarilytica TaxID=1385975 RepID=A0A7X0H913_9BACT|nr:ATP-dependent protease ATPase subunit HslU [Algisphaera agarilytica]MBB6431317.1 ATP-dependent HslUV protease ATP-binding subunit HslU [Algisphaera agarilytica]
MHDLTPRQIVDALDRHVIGQSDAKRAVAVAIRNRWRRRQLEAELSREVYPKNIIMAGPTGVGKTEIARRLAKLASAPFIKVEASKFTEVGYHGRDVESMVRDLVDQSVGLVRAEQSKIVEEKAKSAAEERLLDLLLPDTPKPRPAVSPGDSAGGFVSTEDSGENRQRLRDALRKQLEAGTLDEREVELTVTKRPQTNVMFANMGLDQMDPDMSNMFEKLIPEQTASRKLTVKDARVVLIEQETEKLLNKEKIQAEAVERAQNDGIIFLDEIDKIATPSGAQSSSGGGSGSPDVSRQGVQRDLLPIVEGSAVSTKYGTVHTDHILFIAAGAFHVAAVSDLMPELQGRFPIRVELQALGKADFIRILTEPKNALTKQQQALLGVEGLEVEFEPEAIEAMAELAAQANTTLENIGARRLTTIIEKVFDQVNFDAPERVAGGETKLSITAEFVKQQVAPVVEDADLSNFVL